jgi:DNA-binding transcriptional regulator YiaG
MAVEDMWKARWKPRPYATPEEIAAMRKAAGLDQYKAADVFGISRRTVQKWESGDLFAPKWAVFIYKILAAKRQAILQGRPPGAVSEG